MISTTKHLFQRTSGRFRRHFGYNSRKSTLALLDQAIVGGTAFLTTIAVGRVCGSEELGIFSLGLSIMILAIAAQEALVTAPFTINLRRFQGANRARYTAGVTAHFLVFALAFASVIAASAILVTLTGIGPRGLGPVLWTLSVAVPFRLLRELARRMSYADLNTPAALAIGFVASVMQLVPLAVLAALDLLSAASAFALVGISGAVSGSAWFLIYRPPVRLKRRLMLAVARRNMGVGKWLFVGQVSHVLSSYSLAWLIVAIVDAGQAGVYAACGAIVQLTHPLITAFNNITMPRLSLALAEGGRGEVHRIVLKATLVLAAIVGSFGIVTMVFGSYLLTLVFGSAYAGSGHVLAVLALVPLICVSTQAAGHALFLLQRPRLTTVVQIAGMLAVFPITLLMINCVGILGAALGRLLEASVVATATAFVYWITMFRKAAEVPSNASDVDAERKEDLPDNQSKLRVHATAAS